MPLNPVVMVRKMSTAAGPDLNWPLVRFAGTMEKPRSSFSPAAFSPSPIPVWPWHSQHFAVCHTCLPRAMIGSEAAGGRAMYRGAPGGSSTKNA